MPKVVFFTGIPEQAAEIIVSRAPADYEVAWRRPNIPDEEKRALLEEADFLILYGGNVPPDILRAAKRVKLIQILSAGYENVVLSPHAAGPTYDAWFRRGDFAFQNIQRVWEGKPPESVIHPE